MGLQFERREAGGALLLAAGLLLGGAVSLGARHLGLPTPGLLFESPPTAVLEGVAREAEGAAGSFGDGKEGAGEHATQGTVKGREERLAPVDVNSAGFAELQAIDGVGPALAGRIVALRRERGGYFRGYEELLQVKGIGPATLERIRRSSRLSPPRGSSQKIDLRKSISTHADSSSLHR
jgi:competence protein ComEA